MRDSNEAFLQILFKMVSEVASFSRSTGEDVFNSTKKSFMGLGTAVTRNVANRFFTGLGDRIMEAFDKDAQNNISDLRDKLQAQTRDCISNKKTII